MIFVAVWIKFGSEKWSELLVTPILKPCFKDHLDNFLLIRISLTEFKLNKKIGTNMQLSQKFSTGQSRLDWLYRDLGFQKVQAI